MITLLWTCLRLPGQVLSILANALGAGTERAPQPAAVPRPRLELVHSEPMQPEAAEDEPVHDQPASPALTETIAFSLDGTSYEVDLSPEEASALRRELHRYMAAARPLSRRR